MPKPIKIEYFRSAQKLWFFHIKAGNNKVIAQSEGYKDRCDCLQTIAVLHRGLSSALVLPRSDTIRQKPPAKKAKPTRKR